MQHIHLTQDDCVSVLQDMATNKFPKDDVAEEPVKDLEEMVDKRRVGRPPGRKERITLNMSQEHIGYLKSRDVSYSKTIAALIEKEMEGSNDN